MELNDLYKLTDSELKKKLKRYKALTRGGKAIRKGDNKIITLLDYDSHIGYWYYKNGNGSIHSLSPEQLIPLSYDFVKSTIESKYDYGFNTKISLDSFISFINNRLSSMFDEDKYEIDIEDYGEIHYIKVKLYYPEIEITNSLSLKHTIKDLYVVITFKKGEEKIIFTDLNLFRKTFTPGEAVYNYVHSHYNSRPGWQLEGQVCYGSTDLGKLIEKSRVRLNLRTFSSLIIQIENYLKWESIEGVPHRHISHIKKYDVVSKGLPYIPDIGKVLSDLYKITVNKIDLFRYDFEPTEDGKFKIKINSEDRAIIEKELTNHLIESGFDLKDILIRKIDDKFGDVFLINKEYVKQKGITLNDRIVFRGEEIIPEIIDDSEDLDINIDEMYPKKLRPDLFNSIVNRIEEQFLDYFIKIKNKL